MASKRPFPSAAGPSGEAEGSSHQGASFIKKTRVDDIDDDDDYSPPDEISMSLIDEMDALEEEELIRATVQPPPPIMTTPTMTPTAGGGKPRPPTTPNGAMSSSVPANQHQKPKESSVPAKWRRPPPPPIDPSRDLISFQQIDIDHYIGSSIPGMPGLQSDSVPILRMYGVTMDGNSVCAHLHGFLPYFYVPLPCEQFGAEHCKDFMDALSEAVAGDSRGGRGVTTPVLSVEICQR